jgi:hypothetical protein
MRISENQIELIVQAFRLSFGGGSLYLFGSQVDDLRRGGDIDLYVKLNQYDHAVKAKLDFLVRLKRFLGERRIDVVLGFGGRLIDEEALSKGICLCEF